MAREIPLPHAWYQVALEESLLLDALRNLVPAERPLCIPPADKLGQHLPLLAEDEFPTLSNRDLEPPSNAAERMARLYMAEQNGSLWAAVRDIVTVLPFACQQRQLSAKPAMTYSAGAYGHRSYVGLHKQTSKTPMVCRMINTLIRLERHLNFLPKQQKPGTFAQMFCCLWSKARDCGKAASTTEPCTTWLGTVPRCMGTWRTSTARNCRKLVTSSSASIWPWRPST